MNLRLEEMGLGNLAVQLKVSREKIGRVWGDST